MRCIAGYRCRVFFTPCLLALFGVGRHRSRVLDRLQRHELYVLLAEDRAQEHAGARANPFRFPLMSFLGASANLIAASLCWIPAMVAAL